jgi:hypothetical protein
MRPLIPVGWGSFWTRLDGLVYVNALLDCADRQCIGLNVSQRNDAREAAWADSKTR